MSIHVWKLETITLCNLVVVDSPSVEVITSLELRRRIHTHSRAVVEPTICPTCYAKARPFGIRVERKAAKPVTIVNGATGAGYEVESLTPKLDGSVEVAAKPPTLADRYPSPHRKP